MAPTDGRSPSLNGGGAAAAIPPSHWNTGTNKQLYALPIITAQC